MTDADVRMMRAGGRDLRVATWRLDMPSEHLPVLLFSGIGCNIEAMTLLADSLSDRGCIVFDMPGIGGSAEPLAPYNLYTMSLATAELLDQLRVAQVDILGLSWGGAMAQQFALQHGKRVSRLILCATSAGIIMAPGDLSLLGKLADWRNYLDGTLMQQFYLDGLDGLPESAALMARLEPPNPRAFMYQLIAMAGWTSVPALPFLKKPVLILAGSEDAIVPLANAELLHALIPGSELEVIAGGGHLFLVSHREQSARAIRAFLDREDAHGQQVRRAA